MRMLGEDSIKKIAKTSVAYALWFKAVELDDFKEVKKWKTAWDESLDKLSTDEFLAYLECDLLKMLGRP